MKFTILFLILMVLSILAIAWLLRPGARPQNIRPARHKGFRRAWRRLHLLPVGIHRLVGWLPGSQFSPDVQFANIGEGTFEHGIKSFIPDATAASRYLLYKRGSDSDHCAVCGAGDDPLGPSDDQADTSTGVKIAVKLLGAYRGTTRVVTDGTVANGNYVKCAANGQVTVAASGDLSFGRAIITSDMSSAAGDVITIIPALPAKYTF